MKRKKPARLLHVYLVHHFDRMNFEVMANGRQQVVMAFETEAEASSYVDQKQGYIDVYAIQKVPMGSFKALRGRRRKVASDEA